MKREQPTLYGDGVVRPKEKAPPNGRACIFWTQQSAPRQTIEQSGVNVKYHIGSPFINLSSFNPQRVSAAFRSVR
jgi:hypothetical protein